jgi:hypothetical protein
MGIVVSVFLSLALSFGAGYKTGGKRVERKYETESKSADTRLSELTAENSRLIGQLQQQTSSASAILTNAIAGVDRCAQSAHNAGESLTTVGAGIGTSSTNIRATAQRLIGVAKEVKTLEDTLCDMRASLSRDRSLLGLPDSALEKEE